MGIGLLGRFVGVTIFAANLNILYLQSTAMTELLLIATMTAAVYELLCWFENDKLLSLLKAAFWIMLSTLNRYDGWFLFLFSIAIIGLYLLKKKGYKTTEGTL
ncbi:MAG TPA: family 2 glycosyl transferase, partial [Candidatus Woesebacteria bacterium]|nr:family 2 glycosyl transferase [Candidatus Woesebacteria bacterium]